MWAIMAACEKRAVSIPSMRDTVAFRKVDGVFYAQAHLATERAAPALFENLATSWHSSKHTTPVQQQHGYIGNIYRALGN